MSDQQVRLAYRRGKVGLRLESGFLAIILWLVALVSFETHAETIVLVHGYSGNSQQWRKDGVLPVLQRAGFSYQGDLHAKRNYVYLAPVPTVEQYGDVVYTVDLPDQLSIELQSVMLGVYLQSIYEIRRESFVLVGFSAGGVVARAWLTSKYHLPTKALMTIATPHLGTPVAKYAERIRKTPLKMLMDVATPYDLGRSKSILQELSPAQKGSYLYWLNHLPHPDIFYYSIIRREKSLLKKDFVVPLHSQNMNNVEGISGRSASLLTVGDHSLTPADGMYILQLLQIMKSEAG
ncbi:MAG: Unknown protein [uncultured Thiotrichaceae bacterium]|uniref:GPI inositol-deacylase PGAP1-like alpha/beta domain-containing protein n=1 Tax=uncultured Thiotrichaceae bacterium TaxID=298394 RepID=A0A6S6UCU1_9GAMM|nr:MAG: Unknown protein [uncultured Thiotrichaceae bacterium]